MARNLIPLKFPLRDTTKYPRGEDEPMEEMCRRLGLRPPEPGEDPISWAQSGPHLSTAEVIAVTKREEAERWARMAMRVSRRRHLAGDESGASAARQVAKFIREGDDLSNQPDEQDWEQEG